MSWLTLSGAPPLTLPLQPPPAGPAHAARLRAWNVDRAPLDAGLRALLSGALRRLQSERYRVDVRPRLSRLALPTTVIPGRLRLGLHGLLTSTRPLDRPLDRTADHLRALLGEALPDDPLLALTLDLDSPASVPATDRLTRAAADRGHQLTLFVVGRDVARLRRPLRRWRALGHAVGLHGWVHDLRLAQLSGAPLIRRLRRLRAVVAAHGVAGFRSPALLSGPRLRRGLASIGLRWDSSLPTTDDGGLGGRRGCAATWPYPLDRLTEIPVSAPLDDRLILAGLPPEALVAHYRSRWAEARRDGHPLVIALHPEPHLSGRPDRVAAWCRWLAELETRSVSLDALAT